MSAPQSGDPAACARVRRACPTRQRRGAVRERGGARPAPGTSAPGRGHWTRRMIGFPTPRKSISGTPLSLGRAARLKNTTVSWVTSLPLIRTPLSLVAV